jgi:K+-transporting ATPase ATPase A chain
MANVFEGRRTFLHPVLRWLETLAYRAAGVTRRRRATLDPIHGFAAELQYLWFLLVYLIQRFQGMLPSCEIGESYF